MSDIFSVVAGVASTFGPIIADAGAAFAMISSAERQIAMVFPDIVVEENHHDEMAITQHPVEIGAPITDHAFMQPFTVEIHAMWSNSAAQSEGYVQAVYEQLLAIQASARPFDITTGKRQYSNMLMRSLMVRTDDATEWALDVIAACQQVIIVKSTTTTAGSGSSGGASTPSNGAQSVGGVDPSTGLSVPSSPSAGYSMPPSMNGAGGTAPDASGVGSYSFGTSVMNSGSVNIAPVAP